jgi:hypothetical protein
MPAFQPSSLAQRAVSLRGAVGYGCLRICTLRATDLGLGSDTFQTNLRRANLDTVTEHKQTPAEDDWENEGGSGQQPREKSDREEFSAQEQVSRPDDQANGEKANKPGDSNPDRST